MAHHSAAAKYDALHPLTLTGTVAEFRWRNPHTFLYLDVTTGKHKGRRYVVEMSSAGVLGNNGWTAARLKPGDTVRLTVLPSRAGNPAGLCRDQCEITVTRTAAK